MQYRWAMVALCALPSPTISQDIGDRIRVSTSPADITIGIVSQVTGSGLSLIEGNAVHVFTFDELRCVERSDGMQSRWKQGMYIGTAVGAVLGAVVSYKAEVCDGDPIEQIFFPDDVTCETGNPGTTTIGAIAGAVQLGAIGAGVGWLIKREAWTAISIPISAGAVDGVA